MDTLSQEHIIAVLHEEHPWMKSHAIDAFAKDSATRLATFLAQQQPAMEASKARMGFFSLSAELCNYIYELVLLPDASPEGNGGACQQIRIPHSAHLLAPACPTITQVSRRFRAETLPIYYGGNTFAVSISQEWYANVKFEREREKQELRTLLGPPSEYDRFTLVPAHYSRFLQWLEVIRPENAGRIRRLLLSSGWTVCRLSLVREVLEAQLENRGVRAEPGVVELRENYNERPRCMILRDD